MDLEIFAWTFSKVSKIFCLTIAYIWIRCRKLFSQYKHSKMDSCNYVTARYAHSVQHVLQPTIAGPGIGTKVKLHTAPTVELILW